jgi:hypothetical protein
MVSDYDKWLTNHPHVNGDPEWERERAQKEEEAQQAIKSETRFFEEFRDEALPKALNTVLSQYDPTIEVDRHVETGFEGPVEEGVEYTVSEIRLVFSADSPPSTLEFEQFVDELRELDQNGRWGDRFGPETRDDEVVWTIRVHDACEGTF